jgi:hypothetical protein
MTTQPNLNMRWPILAPTFATFRRAAGRRHFIFTCTHGIIGIALGSRVYLLEVYS